MIGQVGWRGATIAWTPSTPPNEFSERELAEMGSGQIARFRQLSETRARGFLASRALIRDLVRRITGREIVELDSLCERCGADHAAPRTAGVTLSVSHAGDLVVVAAITGAVSLGVDIEPVSAASRMADLGALFGAEEVPDLAGWTRLEAAVKADGRGFEMDPSDVLLHPSPDCVDQPEWSVVLPGGDGRLRVATLDGPAGYVLSAAMG